MLRRVSVVAVLLFGCVRYMGRQIDDVVGEPTDGQSAERTSDGPAADGPREDVRRPDGRPLDGPPSDKSVVPLDKGWPKDGVTPPDLPPMSCQSWSNWICSGKLDGGGLICGATCGGDAIDCDNQRNCTCNGSPCGKYTGAGCMLCADAFQKGCCNP